MRNLLVYPIEASETIDQLKSIRDDEEELQEVYLQIGGTRILCLNLVIKFLEENRVDLEIFLENNR